MYQCQKFSSNVDLVLVEKPTSAMGKPTDPEKLATLTQDCLSLEEMNLLLMDYFTLEDNFRSILSSQEGRVRSQAFGAMQFVSVTTSFIVVISTHAPLSFYILCVGSFVSCLFKHTTSLLFFHTLTVSLSLFLSLYSQLPSLLFFHTDTVSLSLFLSLYSQLPSLLFFHTDTVSLSLFLSLYSQLPSLLFFHTLTVSLSLFLSLYSQLPSLLFFHTVTVSLSLFLSLYSQLPSLLFFHTLTVSLSLFLSLYSQLPLACLHWLKL